MRRAHRPAGAEAWLEDAAELLRAFPDWQWKRIRLIAEDDWIAAHLRGGGAHTGVYRGIAPTRRRVNIAEFGMYRVRAGRIVEHVASGADVEILAQLRG